MSLKRGVRERCARIWLPIRVLAIDRVAERKSGDGGQRAEPVAPTEVVNGEWFSDLVSRAIRPGIGA